MVGEKAREIEKTHRAEAVATVVVMVEEEICECGCTCRLKGTDTELVRGGKDGQTDPNERRANLKRLCL